MFYKPKYTPDLSQAETNWIFLATLDSRKKGMEQYCFNSETVLY